MRVLPVDLISTIIDIGSVSLVTVELEDGRAVEGHDGVDIEWPLAMIVVKGV